MIDPDVNRAPDVQFLEHERLWFPNVHKYKGFPEDKSSSTGKKTTEDFPRLYQQFKNYTHRSALLVVLSTLNVSTTQTNPDKTNRRTFLAGCLLCTLPQSRVHKVKRISQAILSFVSVVKGRMSLHRCFSMFLPVDKGGLVVWRDKRRRIMLPFSFPPNMKELDEK